MSIHMYMYMYINILSVRQVKILGGQTTLVAFGHHQLTLMYVYFIHCTYTNIIIHVQVYKRNQAL